MMIPPSFLSSPLFWALASATLAALAGSVAWVVSRRLILRYRSSLPALLVGPRGLWMPACLMVWSGYAGWRLMGSPWLLAAIITTTLLLIVTVVDYATLRIPNVMTLTLLVWAAIQMLWLGHPTLGAALGGFLVGGIGFFILALMGRGALGMGDVKLAAAIGLLFGFPGVVVALFWGVIFGGLAALALLVTRRAGLKSSFAYGPYLAAGAWLLYMGTLELLPWQ